MIGSISQALKENGLCITFDPVTVLETKSVSPHLVIRDKNYISSILAAHDLEVACFLPSAFFMNYPFDKKLIGENAGLADATFHTIRTIFGEQGISDPAKQKLAKWLAALEKQCLLANESGLSQKMIIIKKRGNPMDLSGISVRNIWDEGRIAEEADKAGEDVFHEYELSSHGIVNALGDTISQFMSGK